MTRDGRAEELDGLVRGAVPEGNWTAVVRRGDAIRRQRRRRSGLVCAACLVGTAVAIAAIAFFPNSHRERSYSHSFLSLGFPLGSVAGARAGEASFLLGTSGRFALFRIEERNHVACYAAGLRTSMTVLVKSCPARNGFPSRQSPVLIFRLSTSTTTVNGGGNVRLVGLAVNGISSISFDTREGEPAVRGRVANNIFGITIPAAPGMIVFSDAHGHALLSKPFNTH